MFSTVMIQRWHTMFLIKITSWFIYIFSIQITIDRALLINNPGRGNRDIGKN
ncbi:MAG TPA: hypothetical protein VLN46_03225 [Gillisia sp.]|nr:hypothetical protein [Gillisia sp.]